MRLWRILVLATVGGLLALFVVVPSPVSAVNQPLAATLTGSQPAPNPGDPAGIGFVFLQLDSSTGSVCFTLFAFVSGALASHIHHAPVGVAGPVVVPLIPPSGLSSSGCVSASPAVVTAIIQHPQEYYVDVHTTLFPGGAVRGQLGR